jgi:hypothetical protein
MRQHARAVKTTCCACVCLTNEALQDITCMYINGAQRDELLTVQLAEVSIDQLDEATELGDLQCKSQGQH